MRILLATLCLAGIVGCEGWQANLRVAAQRACEAVDDKAAEEFVDPEDLEQARNACRLARIAAGLPPDG